jgi:hypothetical protein
MPPDVENLLLMAIVAGLLAGFACGILPLGIGIWKGRIGWGVAALIACAIGGAGLGLLLAVPVALLFCFIIVALGDPRESRTTQSQFYSSRSRQQRINTFLDEIDRPTSSPTAEQETANLADSGGQAEPLLVAELVPEPFPSSQVAKAATPTLPALLGEIDRSGHRGRRNSGNRLLLVGLGVAVAVSIVAAIYLWNTIPWGEMMKRELAGAPPEEKERSSSPKTSPAPRRQLPQPEEQAPDNWRQNPKSRSDQPDPTPQRTNRDFGPFLDSQPIDERTPPAELSPRTPPTPAVARHDVVEDAKLIGGRFDTELPFAPGRDGLVQPIAAKIFVVPLQAGKIYLVAVNYSAHGGAITLRIEDRSRQLLAAANTWDAQPRHSLIFVPPDGGEYRICAVAPLLINDIAYKLTIREVQDGDEVPQFDNPDGFRPPLVEQSLRLKPDEYRREFALNAISPDSATCWFFERDFVEERCSPDFVARRKFSLGGSMPADRHMPLELAVDARGRLYTVIESKIQQRDPALPVLLSSINVYDSKKLGANYVPLEATIDVAGIIPQLFISADQKALYFLDTFHHTVNKVPLDDLKKVESNERISAETRAMCLSPNGKTLYVCASNRVVHVLNAATLKVEKTLHLKEVQPMAIQALDTGGLFLKGSDGYIYAAFAARDYDDGIMPCSRWLYAKDRCTMALSADQRYLYVAIPGPGGLVNIHNAPTLQVMEVGAHPTIFPARKCGEVRLTPGLSLKHMTVSPDGRYVIIDPDVVYPDKSMR